MPGRRLLAPALLLALIAAACATSARVAVPQVTPPVEPTPTGAPASTPQPTEGPTPAATATPPATPPPEVPVETLVWTDCGFLECATLPVPVDHADPEGPTMGLALARARTTTDEERIGSLLINPGGPGGSGIELLTSAAPGFPAGIADRFDLVSWDPRGVGQSRGLDCNDDVADDLNYVPSIDDGLDDDLAAVAEDIRELGADCLATHPDLLDHVGTVATARDLDLIRRALGDERLTYLGYSYGTRIGAVYATLFPDRVRAMVLDGAFPPGLPSSELAASVADIESTLSRIDQVCDLEPGCPVRDQGLVETVTELLGTLDPEDGPLPDLGERATLIGATLLAIYVPEVWETYATALDRAAAGDPDLIANLAAAWFFAGDDEFSDIYAGANTAIMCADRAYPTDPEAARADAELAVGAAPLLVDLALGATCEGWPVDGEALPTTDTAGAPTLLVMGGTNDPATPLRWAEQLATDLADAVLVTYVGDGHTVVARDNDCIDDLVTTYLVTLVPPADGTRCHAATGILGVRVEVSASGLDVLSVDDGSAASAAGLRAGDVVVAVDGEPATALDQLTTGAGQRIVLDVARDGGITPVEVTAGRRPWTLPAG